MGTLTRLLSLAILWFAAFPSWADPGWAFYGMEAKRWPCKPTIRRLRHEVHPKVGILWDAFGRHNRCLTKFLQLPQRKSLEVHLVNECCNRNGTCLPTDFLYGLSPEAYEFLVLARDEDTKERLWEYVAPMAALLNTYGDNLSCYVSPGLESNLSAEAGAILIEWLRPLFPDCKFVWSAMTSGRPKGADFMEYHGRLAEARPAPCIANNDGLDIDFPQRSSQWPLGAMDVSELDDFIAGTFHCAITFVWTWEFNGASLNPDRRHRTNWPTKYIFTQLDPFIQ